MDRYKLWESDKILEDVTEKHDCSVTTCECKYCGKEFTYADEDKHVGRYGIYFVKCPYCGEDTPLHDEGEDVTYQSFRYPLHFEKTKRGTNGALKIEDSQVVDRIKKGINYLRNNRGVKNFSIECGDTFTLISRLEGDESYYIINTHNYMSGWIDFDETDKKLYLEDKDGMARAVIENMVEEMDYIFGEPN